MHGSFVRTSDPCYTQLCITSLQVAIKVLRAHTENKKERQKLDKVNENYNTVNITRLKFLPASASRNRSLETA